MACGGGSGTEEPAMTLVISPADAVLTVDNESPQTQAYTVMRATDSGMEDVTADVTLSVDNVTLGSFSGATLTSSAAHGGKTLVRATLGGETGSANLTVNATSAFVDPALPATTAEDFANATVNSTGGPALSYPENGSAAPPNLGVLDVHYTGNASDTILEIALTSAYTTRRIYLPITTGAVGYNEIKGLDWDSFAGGKGGTVALRSMAPGGDVNVGGNAQVDVIGKNIDGGVYYWATTGSSMTGNQGGTYRHDMANVGQQAEPFFLSTEAPGMECIGCHAVSPDGKYMAASLVQGDGIILDVKTKEILFQSPTGNDKFNQGAFSGDSKYLFGAVGGRLDLRNASDGSLVAGDITGGYTAYHPAVSPNNDQIAFITTSAPAGVLSVREGSLVTMSWDGGTNFGTPQVIATPRPASAALQPETYHYPDYSPDGEWILLNASQDDAGGNQYTGNSNDAVSAEVYITKADGSGQPIRLDAANITRGLTNSWPRWAPFQQANEAGEPFYWLTFSSKRDFGNRSTAQIPQLWMAPLYPERLGTANNPTAAAIWLPFQNLNTHNHIGQWTQKVITID